MPEGDAVFRFARKIRDALQDQVVRAAHAQGPGAVPRAERLIGATCTAVTTHGKNLVITFDNGLALRGHLRMYGTWELYKPGEPWRRHPNQARLVLHTDETVLVNFSAPVIELHESRALGTYRPLTYLGPDLLDDAFDPGESLRRFRDPLRAGATIGDAIMDQEIMAGVGNIWKHETLFHARVNPWLRVRELPDDELGAIIAKARELLRGAAGLAHDAHGRPSMYVYARAGQPCRRCYSRIRSDVQGRDIRRTAWCPSCQPVREAQELVPRSHARSGGRPRRGAS